MTTCGRPGPTRWCRGTCMTCSQARASTSPTRPASRCSRSSAARSRWIIATAGSIRMTGSWCGWARTSPDWAGPSGTSAPRSTVTITSRWTTWSGTRVGPWRSRPGRATWRISGGRRRSSTASSWAATTCAASSSGGAGPHAVGTDTIDSIGGRFIYTGTTELRFPLPISPDLGISGRAFVDVGSLSQVTQLPGTTVFDNASPRVGAGVGVSWKTPFGLINIDIAQAVVKYKYDQTQLFRFGFGTRF